MLIVALSTGTIHIRDVETGIIVNTFETGKSNILTMLTISRMAKP